LSAYISLSAGNISLSLSVLLSLVAPSAQRGAESKQRKRTAPRSEKAQRRNARRKEIENRENERREKYVDAMRLEA
jgi:hypothetical protein